MAAGLLAKYAKGMGARVIVCEPEPVKLLEAYAEGYEAMNSLEAAEIGEIFLTGTGNLKVLREEHFARMKDGVLLANAGHYDHEFDLAYLAEKVGRRTPDWPAFFVGQSWVAYGPAEGPWGPEDPKWLDFKRVLVQLGYRSPFPE